MTAGADAAAVEARDGTVLRPTVVAWSVLAAVAMAFVFSVVTADGADSLAGRLGGDFPAFYGAGSIVADGDAADLYDVERQIEAQAELFPGDTGVLYFAYPPPVAVAYGVLARLPYVAAYVVHTLVMVGAAVGAHRLLRPMLPAHAGSVVAAVAITFLPVFMAVTLGQNTALLVLLLAASWRAARDGRDGLAGLALGLLLFKPQYAVPLIGLHLVRGRPRTVAVAGVVAAGWWVAGVAVLGTGWVGAWVDQVGDFTVLDAEVNGANAVSVLGVAEHVLGVGTPLAVGVAGPVVAVVVVVLVGIWWRAPADRLALPMASASAGILLVSPHAMFYDAGIVALTVAGLAAASWRGPHRWRLVAAAWLLGALHPAKEVLGITPVSLVVVGAFAVAVWAVVVVDPSAGRAATAVDVLGPGRDTPQPPRLSVVIPAYDEAGRIEPTLDRLEGWLAATGVDAEVLVVDDGSTDDTASRCLAFADRLPGLRVLRLAENRGKGHAVRVGMLAATGEWRAFLDADGSTDPTEVPKLLDPGVAVAIASVAVDGAQLDRAQSGIRSSLGRFGNTVIQRLVLPGIVDSQRGCKVFRGDVADAVFGRCTVDGWGFDVEALALARSLGHEPLEVGVRWEHRPVGHVRPWHYVTTIVEVLRVRHTVGRQAPVTGPPPGPTTGPATGPGAVHDPTHR